MKLPETVRPVRDPATRPSSTFPETVATDASASAVSSQTFPLAVFTWSRRAYRLEADVTRRRAHGDLAELPVDLDVGRAAREVEARTGGARDPALEVAAPRDLDRPPAEAVLLLDPDEMLAAALVHDHVDLVTGILAATVDDLHGRPRFVGRGHHHATARKPHLQ